VIQTRRTRRRRARSIPGWRGGARSRCRRRRSRRQGPRGARRWRAVLAEDSAWIRGRTSLVIGAW